VPLKSTRLFDVPEDEYATMGPNILAIKPNFVFTIEGNNKTKKLLEKEGIKALTYKGKEISLKAEGGATCLTRPILRA
jgi:dimethylargininase